MSRLSERIAIRIIDCASGIKDMIFPHTCRKDPTCSLYAKESIRKYGLIRGSFKGAGRLLRCNPFNKSFYDPVR